MQNQDWNVFRSISFVLRWTSLLLAKASKVFMYILLSALTVGTGIVAKLVILLMTSDIRPDGHFIPYIASGPTKSIIPQKSKELHPASASWFYWSLWLAFCVPEILTLFQCIGIVCFKSIPAPTVISWCLAVIIEILHTIGVSLLVFIILPELDIVRGTTLLCATAILPALFNIFVPINGEASSRLWYLRFFDHLAFVMQASAPWIWPAFDKSFSLRWKLTIPFALLLTSLGWWKNSVNRSSRRFVWLDKIKNELQQSRYKISMLTSVLKCVVCLFCMIIIYGSKHSTQNIFDLSNPFEIYMNASALNFERNRIGKSQYANYMCLTLILATFLGYLCAELACKVKMNWFAYVLLVATIAPLTVVITLVRMFSETIKHHIYYFSTWRVPDELFWNCDYGDDQFNNLVIQNFELALVLFLLPSYVWVTSRSFNPKIGRQKRTDT